MFKNYTKNQVVLPLGFSFQLEKRDIGFTINQLVESIPEEYFFPFDSVRSYSAIIAKI